MKPLKDGRPIAASINRIEDGSLVSVGGLTIRDWFAGMALQGFCSQRDHYATHTEHLAGWAYEQSDAMLAARERKGGA